jgi:hypothetical protein
MIWRLRKLVFNIVEIRLVYSEQYAIFALFFYFLFAPKKVGLLTFTCIRLFLSFSMEIVWDLEITHKTNGKTTKVFWANVSAGKDLTRKLSSGQKSSGKMSTGQMSTTTQHYD